MLNMNTFDQAPVLDELTPAELALFIDPPPDPDLVAEDNSQPRHRWGLTLAVGAFSIVTACGSSPPASPDTSSPATTHGRPVATASPHTTTPPAVACSTLPAHLGKYWNSGNAEQLRTDLGVLELAYAKSGDVGTRQIAIGSRVVFEASQDHLYSKAMADANNTLKARKTLDVDKILKADYSADVTPCPTDPTAETVASMDRKIAQTADVSAALKKGLVPKGKEHFSELAKEAYKKFVEGWDAIRKFFNDYRHATP